jgi:hypothetical protein
MEFTIQPITALYPYYIVDATIKGNILEVRRNLKLDVTLIFQVQIAREGNFTQRYVLMRKRSPS